MGLYRSSCQQNSAWTEKLIRKLEQFFQIKLRERSEKELEDEKRKEEKIEKLLKERRVRYEREKLVSKTGSDISRADFIIDNSIVLELKVIPVVTRDDYYQLLRYLEFSNLRLGMIVNFRHKYLKPKRVLNPKYKE
mgnify:CR=1 FL=1